MNTFFEFMKFLSVGNYEEMKKHYKEEFLEMSFKMSFTFGIEINCKAIHMACSHNSIDMITYLLEKGCDINSKTKEGVSPIHIAVFTGYLDVVKYLVDQNCNLEALGEHKMGVLHYSIRNYSNIHLLELMYNQPRPQDYFKSNVEVVKYLVEKGCNVNSRDKNGMTLIHYACVGNNIDIIDYLIENGASANAEDNRRSTPLHVACDGGNVGLIRHLVELGCDVDHASERGQRPLHIAARRNLECVQYLVEQGCDVHATDNDMSNAVHFAAMCGHIDIVRYLFEKGVDIDLKTTYFQKPVDLAAVNDRQKMVTYLVSLNCSLEDTITYIRKKSFGSEILDVVCAYENRLSQRSKLNEVMKRVVEEKEEEEVTPICHKCNINSVDSFIDCGHVFCNSCIVDDTECYKCHTTITYRQRIFF